MNLSEEKKPFEMKTLQEKSCRMLIGMNKKRILLVLFSCLVSLMFLSTPVFAQAPEPVVEASPKNDSEVAARIRENIRKEREKPRATVRGRVVYADTGMPVRYTDIGFVGADPKTRTVYQTTQTDENGEYVFKGLVEGTYYPDVKNAGLIRPSSFPNKRFQGQPKNGEQPLTKELFFQKLTVQGDGVFRYDVSVRRAAAISGVVSYFDGEPASDLVVQIAKEVNGAWVPMPGYGPKNPFKTKTDDLGYYRLSGLLPGKYKVFVTEPVRHTERGGGASFQFTTTMGKSPFQTYYSAEDGKTEGDILEVFSGQFVEDININLPEKRLYDLSGIVIDKSTGEPLKGFNVSFRPKVEKDAEGGDSLQSRLMLLTSAFTRGMGGSRNEKGADWELRNLLPGKYVLTATQIRPYRSEEKKDEEEIRYPSVSQEVEVTDSNIENIRIEVPIGGALKFQVISDDGKKVSRRMMLWLKNVETGVEIPQQVFVKDENGIQVVDAGKIPSGEYEMSVTARGFFTRSIEGASGNILEVEDGDELNDIKVYMSSALGTVQGRVTGLESGKEAGIFPIIEGEDFYTTLMKSESRSAQGRVKKDGSFSMKLAPGEYALVVVTRDEIQNNPQGLYSLINERSKTATKVTIRANETVNMDLRKQ